MFESLRSFFDPPITADAEQSTAKLAWVVRLRWVAIAAQLLSIFPALEFRLLEAKMLPLFCTVIATLAVLNIRAHIPRLANLVTAPVLVSLQLIATLAFRIIVEASLAMLLLAIPDYMFQRRQHRESLKMSRQELKEERKMYEGDPLIKSRMRERMQEMLTRNMMRAVPQADVVITNPTHFAVAMEWNRRLMEAPTVVAKGADEIARKMREIATENDVPLVENKPLARALYQEVEIGDVIPEKFYEVMAMILAEVYKIQGKTAEAV